MSRRPWSPEDRKRYGEGDRLRASSVPGRRGSGPSADEWEEILEEGLTSADDESRVLLMTSTTTFVSAVQVNTSPETLPAAVLEAALASKASEGIVELTDVEAAHFGFRYGFRVAS